jgi:hypothetical protein
MYLDSKRKAKKTIMDEIKAATSPTPIINSGGLVYSNSISKKLVIKESKKDIKLLRLFE